MRRLLAPAAVTLALTLAPALHATTVVALPFEVLAQAPLVVRVNVLAAEAVAVDAGPGVVTDYRVVVHQDLRGSGVATGTELVVRIPGGALPDRDVQIEGMPELAPGSELVLFLEPIDAFDEPCFIPFGLNQGVWDRVPGDVWAPRPQDGLIGQVPSVEPLGLSELVRALDAVEVRP